MKYKIKNKTEIYTKYADVVFAPKEEKILELETAYEHANFDIEKQEKLRKVEKKKIKKKEVKRKDGIIRKRIN